MDRRRAASSTVISTLSPSSSWTVACFLLLMAGNSLNAFACQLDVVSTELNADRSPAESSGDRKGGPRAHEGVEDGRRCPIGWAAAAGLPGFAVDETNQSLGKARALMPARI